jgi:prepilin-type N-terminal cleavage/methylation domain-containing protein
MNNLNKGFTLIELLVMIIILGILGSLSSVRIKNISSNVKVTSAINQIRADIDMVKELALSSHNNMSISFNQSQESYTVFKNGSIMQDYPESENGVIKLSDGSFSNVDITSINFNNSNIISFDKWGNVLNSGFIVLNQNHTLQISGINGIMEISN